MGTLLEWGSCGRPGAQGCGGLPLHAAATPRAEGAPEAEGAPCEQPAAIVDDLAEQPDCPGLPLIACAQRTWTDAHCVSSPCSAPCFHIHGRD